MTNAPRNQPPQDLPILTEVVDMPENMALDQPHGEYEPALQPPGYESGPQGAGGPETVFMSPAQVNEQMMVERVLSDLEKQVDLMFEHRLRETLAPSLSRIADMLVRETRNELALTLREMVARAVAAELARHPGR
ncbi:MAG TPA: hypothetical protein VE029_04885 [Rhizobacter sp.]|nr:hypothetical protein [Rhizobacter sp.]